MPTNKDFKKLVRARMQKTGESYTSARAMLLGAERAKRPTTDRDDVHRPTGPQPTDAAAPIGYATLAGMSEAAVEKATGCGWAMWVFVLDHAGAHTWSHRAIAEHVRKAYRLTDWWAQSVTVGYERIKGLRAIGQRRSGSFEANKSKTLAASAPAVFRACADARTRRVWLPGVTVIVRRATEPRSLRMTWPDGTSVEMWITAKGAKASLQVQHRNLDSQQDADHRRIFWSGRLAALGKLLAGSQTTSRRR